ncbi:hypothetical protein BIW11_01195, partial [Tropilaelaps mercedesae]
ETKRDFVGSLATVDGYGPAYSSTDGVDRRLRSANVTNHRDEDLRGLSMQTRRATQGMEAAMILRWTGGCCNERHRGTQRNSIGCSTWRHLRASDSQSKLWIDGRERQKSSRVGRKDTGLPSVVDAVDSDYQRREVTTTATDRRSANKERGPDAVEQQLNEKYHENIRMETATDYAYSSNECDSGRYSAQDYPAGT